MLELTIENLYATGLKSFGGMFWAKKLAQVFKASEERIIALCEQLVMDGYLRQQRMMVGSPVYLQREGAPDEYTGREENCEHGDVDEVIEILDEVTATLLYVAQQLSGATQRLGGGGK